MNQIKNIKIEHVKGKKTFECKFNCFDANYANLVVAPNGFGKSTLAVAFESLKSNRIELQKQDIFEKDDKNKPSLLLELIGENAGIFLADTSRNDISKNISVSVINSPVFAKGKSKNFGKFSTNEAVMSVEEIIIESKIPMHREIEEIKMKNIFPTSGKVFFTLKEILSNAFDMSIIVEALVDIKKIYSQKGTLKAVDKFCITIANIENKGTVSQMRNSIDEDACNEFLSNERINIVFNLLSKLKKLPCDKNSMIDMSLVLLQLVENIKNRENDFRDVFKWLQYKELRQNIDTNIEWFNTTHRKIKTQVKKDKLIVQFPPASEMSNGERDVITFIVQILKFQSTFSKSVGILVIDEIFDYLDGSNMLIAQYYLSKMIDMSQNDNKIFFSIILTHLDPYLFNNYYLKNIKVHYLKEFANVSGKEIISFLKIRTAKNTYPEMANKIEQGYIHYCDRNISMTQEEKNEITDSCYYDSNSFKLMVTKEVEKYLEDKKYDPLKVICGIRVKVEEIAFKLLINDDDKTEFFNTHTTSRKLSFVEDKIGKVSESLYLLAPLYNDALHMELKDNNKNLNKVKSICLKLDNLVVKKIVQEIFN